MVHDVERAVVPDTRETMQADWVPPGRDELARRLAQMADKHPSSARYETADRGQQAGVDRPATEGAARSDTDRADAHGADTDRADGDGADGDGADGGGPDAGRGVADESRDSGWQAPGVRDHPDRPDPDNLRLPDDRARHILDGDGAGTNGGGHCHGTGREGKTEFPENWPDETVLSMVMDVAREPDAAERQDNGRWLASGDRDGVHVWVVVQPDGRIWTAWPEPGGKGVIENPRT